MPSSPALSPEEVGSGLYVVDHEASLEENVPRVTEIMRRDLRRLFPVKSLDLEVSEEAEEVQNVPLG